jgi:hypothetical protein
MEFERFNILDPTPEDIALDEAERAAAERRKARILSPGDWTYEDTMDAFCGNAYCSPEGCPENHRSGLYAITGPDWFHEGEPVSEAVVANEADARLIVAAPELLAAAKKIASFAVSWQPLTPGDIKELTDAIVKAEGK